MAQYNTGVVNTSSSSDVHGIGTAWDTDSNVQAGDLFKILDSDAIYTVASVTGDSDLTLTAVYSGPLASGLEYQVTRDFTPNYSIPEVHAGDVNWPSIVTQALRDIDNVISSNLTVTNSDLASAKSDLIVDESDIASIKSDLVVTDSDLASAKSDLIVAESDLASAKSDIIVSNSDIIANRSDLTAVQSDMSNSIRDGIIAFNAMETTTVSDVIVGLAEILAAMSDALPYV